MTDKIGVLGEATAVAIGTATVYTVPSAKAAKVSIMMLANAGADSLGGLKLTVNGMDIAEVLTMTTVVYYYSNALGPMHVGTTALPIGTTTTLAVSPGPGVYYLSAGDTITYTVTTTALTSMNIQVVGSEIDV